MNHRLIHLHSDISSCKHWAVLTTLCREGIRTVSNATLVLWVLCSIIFSIQWWPATKLRSHKSCIYSRTAAAWKHRANVCVCVFFWHCLPSWIFSNVSSSTLKRHLIKRHLALSEAWSNYDLANLGQLCIVIYERGEVSRGGLAAALPAWASYPDGTSVYDAVGSLDFSSERRQWPDKFRGLQTCGPTLWRWPPNSRMKVLTRQGLPDYSTSKRQARSELWAPLACILLQAAWKSVAECLSPAQAARPPSGCLPARPASLSSGARPFEEIFSPSDLPATPGWRQNEFWLRLVRGGLAGCCLAGTKQAAAKVYTKMPTKTSKKTTCWTIRKVPTRVFTGISAVLTRSSTVLTICALGSAALGHGFGASIPSLWIQTMFHRELRGAAPRGRQLMS